MVLSRFFPDTLSDRDTLSADSLYWRRRRDTACFMRRGAGGSRHGYIIRSARVHTTHYGARGISGIVSGEQYYVGEAADAM